MDGTGASDTNLDCIHCIFGGNDYLNAYKSESE